ncbi:uncharacterized protein TNIN_92231 [Trichonephila inaurata madagascariensis]|uniref:Uncharacterized protein n=1 Tax=Trichonephila inaurata madagascariensis TaxID=2747483 RepID=A0A8X6YK04_9ARAC|nr:uncharacterized protein TNIN_92231 [Trichonephila inaurata madagascariensis]
MGGGETSSSDDGIHITSADRNLLKFYRKHFEELQRKDDKYKEKIDRHLRDLIADRHELEAEVLRRGEKISDLQKALVDLQLNCFEERERFLNVTVENEKLKKNEERLHESIRHLLNVTKDKELRDQVIYTLQDPKVEVGVRYNPTTASSSLSKLCLRRPSEELLKEQIQLLQKKIDEYSNVSKSKSDVIVEDCKLALEKSRERLLQNEQEINFLKKKLQETENEVSKHKHVDYDLFGSYKKDENVATNVASSSNKSSSLESMRFESNANKSANIIHSTAIDLHLTLTFLSKVLNKVFSLLNNIQATGIFLEVAKLPNSETTSESYVNENDIKQFLNSTRQCTRLSFDVSNLWKSLNKNYTSEKIKGMYLNIESELKELESVVEELAISTAETDLLCVSLSRATFFDYLTGPKQPFEKFGVKETNNHSKYVSDMYKMETTVKLSKNLVTQAVNFAKRIIQKSDVLTNIDQTDYSLLKNSHYMDNINRVQETQNHHLQIHVSKKSSKQSNEFSTSHLYKINKDSSQERIFTDSIRADDVTRSINKTLEKINQLESGQCYKDDAFCKHLSEQFTSLAEKLKDLYTEFNEKNMRDQFSEYSALTLNKLEALAKRSQDAVRTAEAQLTANRDNERRLSKKLMDTEELLRESVHECLVLKQKLQHERLHRETDKIRFSRELHEQLHKASDFDELETAVKEIATGRDSNKEPKSSHTHECMYCRQGSDHKLCIEKIKELRASNRKLSTELKTRNSSLLEQLKLEKGRLKNMERYRKLEVEGFQTDIKILKDKIYDLEKQLMKAVLIFEHDKKDQELLKTIHTTAQHSKQATGAIRRLKAKLYELESDIKNL